MAQVLVQARKIVNLVSGTPGVNAALRVVSLHV